MTAALHAPRPPAAGKRDRIRVTFCVDNLGVGGTELNAVRTAEKLDRTRFDLSLVSLQSDGALLSRYEQQGIPVFGLSLPRLHSIRALREGARLTRFLATNRTDIVHSHDVYNAIFSTVAARIARTPVVIASRRWIDDVPRRALQTANRYVYPFVDCVLVNSNTIGEVVEGEGVRRERIAVVPNFVDESAFKPLPASRRAAMLGELGIPPNATVVGCVAGLRPVKDHATLLHAFAFLRPRWPTLRLLLIGDGEARRSLADLAVQLQIADTVIFAGARANDPNPHGLLDISALCSRSEAFPNSLVEAMAAARPVVATRVGGVGDATVDGVTGHLVPAGDPASVASALHALVSDVVRRREMGRAGQQRARELFHADRVIPRLEALYDRLLARKSRR